jgi:hypothetical protein
MNEELNLPRPSPRPSPTSSPRPRPTPTPVSAPRHHGSEIRRALQPLPRPRPAFAQQPAPRAAPPDAQRLQLQLLPDVERAQLQLLQTHRIPGVQLAGDGMQLARCRALQPRRLCRIGLRRVPPPTLPTASRHRARQDAGFRCRFRLGLSPFSDARTPGLAPVLI